MIGFDEESLLSEFPTNIKLSYENLAHKKVCNADIMMAVPKGQKCFVWFTEYNDENTCFLLEIGNGTQIKKVQKIYLYFEDELVYNTILQGTLFYEEKTRLFSIEDIFYYKGQDMTNCDWINKFATLQKLLQTDILQKEKQHRPYMHFGVPIFSTKLEELLSRAKHVKYRIEKIHYYLFGKVGSFLYAPYKQICTQQTPTYTTTQNQMKPNVNYSTLKQKNEYRKDKKEVVFKVKPDIQNDIYILHSLTDDKIVETACIPDYKTSVLMNRLFRNIKENEDLDKLEESDDDEEFENESPERFVHLERTYNMACILNHKFKKWVPVRLV